MFYSKTLDHIGNFTFILVTIRVPVAGDHSENLSLGKVWKRFGNLYSILRRDPEHLHAVSKNPICSHLTDMNPIY